MARTIQVTFDAVNPPVLRQFWCTALGYIRQPPPDGFDDWESAVASWGITPEHFEDFDAIVDPDGNGPRIFIQKVPEPKTAKNRVHLDVNVGGNPADRADRVRAHVQDLVAAGGAVQREFTQNGEFWIVMTDPEGNEFCVQ